MTTGPKEPTLHITVEPVSTRDIKRRCCCNCGHNLRIPDKTNPMFVDHNECEIDGHYIGYVACFENCCKHWKKEQPKGEIAPC